MKSSVSIFVIIFLLPSCDSPTPNMDMNETDYILTNQVAENKTPSAQYIIFDQDSIIYQFQAGLADERFLDKLDKNYVNNK